MGGYYISQPKYLESQYGTSASGASFFTGSTTTLSLALGIISGGLIIRFFKPGPRALTTYMFIVGLFVTFGLFSGLFLGCPRKTFFEERPDHSIDLLSSTCNSGCGCSQEVFQPVCGADKKTNYFSPCAAGCRTPVVTQNDKNVSVLSGFKNCECEEDKDHVTSGYCKADCGSRLTQYITIVSIGKLISSTAFTGNILVRLRCVEERDKSFAIGITKTLLALTASIPYPLLFGAVTDSACIIWETSCGRQGYV